MTEFAAHWDARDRPGPLRALHARALAHFDLFYNLVLMANTRVGSFELIALLAVARLGEEAYGLAVRRELLDRTGRDYSVGAVYTTLQRLEDKGLVSSEASEPLPVRGGRSRRQFRLTAAGMRALGDAQRKTAALWSGIRILRPEVG